jgi:hypothetical protein
VPCIVLGIVDDDVKEKDVHDIIHRIDNRRVYIDLNWVNLTCVLLAAKSLNSKVFYIFYKWQLAIYFFADAICGEMVPADVE